MVTSAFRDSVFGGRTGKGLIDGLDLRGLHFSHGMDDSVIGSNWRNWSRNIFWHSKNDSSVTLIMPPLLENQMYVLYVRQTYLSEEKKTGTGG